MDVATHGLPGVPQQLVALSIQQLSKLSQIPFSQDLPLSGI
jgi:hypothetical protein